jgi:uncharacterized membrane protein YfcA
MATALVLLGVASGILAGLLGVGGGIIIVPVLTLAFGVPHVVAKGTSLAVILPTAVIGTVRNRRSQLTALTPAAVVGLAGMTSAYAASKLSLELDPAVSQTLFAALLTLVAARLARTGITALRAERAGADAATAGPARNRPAGIAETGEAHSGTAGRPPRGPATRRTGNPAAPQPADGGPARGHALALATGWP